MIDYKMLEKKYLKHIPLKFKRMLGDKIYEPYCQDILEKALTYNLPNDTRDLFSKGKQDSDMYPGLYYLACIYIHPLTIVQHILNETEKM